MCVVYLFVESQTYFSEIINKIEIFPSAYHGNNRNYEMKVNSSEINV